VTPAWRSSDSGQSVSRRGQLLFAAAVGLLLLAAFLARLAGAPGAFDQGELVTLDGDSLYHLRRMRLIAGQFPAVPWIDPLIAWPDGGPIPWAAGFDLLGALFILLGHALGGPHGADLWVAALCPVLGIAVVAASVELTLALLPDAPGRRVAALAGGLFAALLPQGLASSRFGRIDHHVAEALAMILLARWALAVVPPGDRTRRQRLAFEVAGSTLSAGAVLVFTGSPLYVALVVPILVGAALASARPLLLGSGGPGLLVGGVLAGLATVPAVAAHGRSFAFGFPSWLQPLLLAAAGSAVSLSVLVGTRVRPGWRRWASTMAAFAVLVLAGTVALPGGVSQAMAGIREWLLKADPWLRTIDEFQPLHSGRGLVAGALRFFGVTGLVAPLLLPLGWWAARRRVPSRALGFLWVALALAALTLLQVRFGRVFAPFLAVAAGLTAFRISARLGERSAAVAVPLLATVLLLDPAVRAALAPAEDPVPNAMVEVARELRHHLPGPAPGVLTPWDLGNEVLTLAGRPVVATGFGPYPDPSAYWETVMAFSSGEAELLPWLARRRVGWVAAGAANLFGRVRSADALIPFSAGDFDHRWLQGTPSAPLLIAGSGIPSLGVHHFEHLMPVLASTRTVGGLKRPLPVIWLYEVVAGATLHGEAQTRARVVVEIPISEHGRSHTWRAWTDADGEGRWSMRVPLPTDLATPTLATGPGRLSIAGEAPGGLRLTEAMVRAGAVVAWREAAAPPP
jgi:asparagine N-glycosylation enzyme membrane subunit Stt3